MFDVEGYILVGGNSRRMGQDKAQLRLGMMTVLERIVGQLTPATSAVSTVGARHEYSAISLPNVPDFHERWGTLAGIHAALSNAQSDWVIVVACDLPFVTRELFERLILRTGDAVDAVVPRQPDGRPQPVCAVYRRETCLPKTEQLIREGEHTPRALLANVRTHYAEFSTLDDLLGAENLFLNLNTPEDFEIAKRLVLTE